MAMAFDGSHAPDRLARMPCGGIPEFDYGSGCAYRCDHCSAVIGSIAMPRHCSELIQEEKDRTTVINALTN